ncbi:glycosyltransferase family 4 protein [Caenimonas sp. SL110]|uniref:glycosyltransferase family 4 protein n=1 Tax=Caenimonas sp. SL110 TaxID=1450524 RepID=UPI0006535DD5|nr:glycosyltransferase family 4 protein [Caenimonas sp. SL110]
MKVLFVTQTAAVRGGVERWLANLCTGLIASGVDVVLAYVDGPVFHDAQAYLTAFPELEAVPHVIVRSPSGTARGRIRALEQALKALRPNIVVPVLVHETLAATQARKLAGDNIRLVYPLHENEVWAFEAVARNADAIDAVISVNRLMLQALQAWAGWPADRSHHIRAGVAVPLHAPHTPRTSHGSERLVIGYCGKLVENQKRAADLIGFCRQLDIDMPAYELRIAGEGDLQPTLEHELADQVQGGRVRFVGTLDPAQLHNDFYPSLDALLITSDWETGPLVAWEAMMHGAAVLTTAYRGLRSEGLLRHGDNALVFPIGQPETAATLLAHAHGQGLLTNIGRQGRITAHAELTLELMTTRWIAALQAIHSQPAKPAPAGFESHDISIAQWLHDLLRGALNRPLAGADAHEEWPRYSPGRTDPHDRAAFSARLDLLEADPEMAPHA